MLFNCFRKPNMIEGLLFIEVDGTIRDYANKMFEVGRKCSSGTKHYCMEWFDGSDKWVNEDHTIARVGFKGDKKAWQIVRNLSFVCVTNEEVQ